MIERCAFLRAICEQPDDDTPRLVYADWLEEFGGEPERAEFIRVQVELARFYSGTFDITPGYTALFRRETELLLSASAEDEGPAVCSAWADKYEFTRGFVSHVTCTAADFLSHAAAIHWHPMQTCVCLVCDGAGAGLFKCPACDKGRVPRPCPETAMPVCRVVFTAWTADDRTAVIRAAHAALGTSSLTGNSYAMVLGLIYPGVEFELPAVPQDPASMLESSFTHHIVPQEDEDRLRAAADTWR